MTISFGASNVYYIPEGENLTIYDINSWRKFEWDIHKTEILLQGDYLQQIRFNIEEAYKNFHKKIKDKKSIDAAKNTLNDFFDSLKCLPPRLESSIDFTDLFTPQTLRMWVRLSDAPMESFKDEDYLRIGKKTAKKKDDFSYIFPLPGAFYFSHIAHYEASLPFEEGKEAFYIRIPGDSFKICELDPLSLLPIINEFVGQNGSSSNGNIVNYTSKGKISTENLICVPLNNMGNACFATLYCQLETEYKHEVIYHLTEKESDFVVTKLLNFGYSIITEENENYVIKKDNSIIHFYNNCSGKEDEGSRFLPPLILAVQYNGSIKSEDRKNLINDVKKILKNSL